MYLCVLWSVYMYLCVLTRGTCMFEYGRWNQIATNQSYLNKNTTQLENMLKQPIL
jgi:hypothetical protein